MNSVSQRNFCCEVSPDRLRATLRLQNQAPIEPLDVGRVIAEIERQKIVIDEEGHNNIRKFCSALDEGNTPPPVQVAQGFAVKDGQNGRIETLYDRPDGQAESTPDDDPAASACPPGPGASHYDRSHIITVKKGQKLVRIVPPLPGEDGRDVYGNVITPKIGYEVTLRIGDNIRQAGDTLLAACHGQLLLNKDQIRINPRLEIPGDVDFSVGNIDFPGDVEITGNVLDLFRVVSASSVIIHGVGEAADVFAMKNLEVRGGIAGKEKGIYSAGNDLIAKYITNTEAHAGHNIKVKSEIINSTVICGGQLAVEAGPVVGGRCVVRGGVHLKECGSTAGVKTVIEAGIDDDFRQFCMETLPKIHERQHELQQLKKQMNPLIENQKYLDRIQKQRLADSLRHYKLLLNESKQIKEELQHRYHESQKYCKAEINVADRIHSGVVIRLGRYETKLMFDLAGPLTIQLRMVQDMETIVAISAKSDSQYELVTDISLDEIQDQLDPILSANV